MTRRLTDQRKYAHVERNASERCRDIVAMDEVGEVTNEMLVKLCEPSFAMGVLLACIATMANDIDRAMLGKESR